MFHSFYLLISSTINIQVLINKITDTVSYNILKVSKGNALCQQQLFQIACNIDTCKVCAAGLYVRLVYQ